MLDVKLRSDQVRATRMRVTAFAIGLAFATILSFFLIWSTGAWALQRFVYENKAFAITNIDVQTDGVIAPEQLRRWAGVHKGDNLLALDLGRIKRDLELISVVRSVAVERLLPGTLRLRVSEREPLAQVYVPQPRTDGTCQINILRVDEDGMLMSLLDAKQLASPSADTNDVLPVISGLNPGQLAPGHRLDSPEVKAALRLVEAFQRSPLFGQVDLRLVDVASPQVIIASVSDGSEVTFGTQDLDRQLRRWWEIYDLGLKLNKNLVSLDLSVPNNIPARWLETNAPPVVKPHHTNPPHTRRHNV